MPILPTMLHFNDTELKNDKPDVYFKTRFMLYPISLDKDLMPFS